MSKNRGFEIALTTEKMVHENKAVKVGVPQYDGIKLPKRGTKRSAGYDLCAAEDIIIPSIWRGLGDVFEIFGDTLVNKVRGYVDSLREHNNENKEYEEFYKRLFNPTHIHTGLKAYMQDDEVLEIYVRSSTPKRFGLILANSVGIIDADYYNNPDNDGEIQLIVYNILPFDVKIKKGERIAQGIFKKFLKADNDIAGGDRLGGQGSTGSN